jgi:hypothetical protein
MTDDELRRLERSPSVRAREVHVNKFPLRPLLLVPAGRLSDAVVRAVLETVAPLS